MHRTSPTRHPAGPPSWGPAPGWGQSLPGWSPLVEDGPLALRAASAVARWWWPIVALAGFGAVAGLVLGHDSAPGLSTRGLATIALAALVMVLLTLHRAAGPWPLTRAVAEYAVVAVLAGLLAADVGGVAQPPADPVTSAARSEAGQAARARPDLEAGEDSPGVLRVAAAVARAVTKAIRAVTGAARWVVDLWRRAGEQANRPGRSLSSTTPTGETMPRSPAVGSTSTRRPL